MSPDQPTASAESGPDFGSAKPAKDRRWTVLPALQTSPPPTRRGQTGLTSPARRRGQRERLSGLASARLLAPSRCARRHATGHLPTARRHAGQPAQRMGSPAADRRRPPTAHEAGEYLDRGLGECWLRQPRVAEVVEGALRFFDGERCHLRAWVIIPNHVHVLLDVLATPLAELLRSWKGTRP